MQPPFDSRDVIERVERELTLLGRRVQKVRPHPSGEDPPLERAAYAILSWLQDQDQDQGPVRAQALVERFQLDGSTVSRQVAALVSAGLVVRVADQRDGRARLLELTGRGRDVLEATREARRGLLCRLLAAWPQSDRAAFGYLLERFNAGLDDLSAMDDLSPVSSAPGVSPHPTQPVGSTDRHGR